MSTPQTRTTRPETTVAPAPGFAPVEALAHELVGVRLFTVLAWDAARYALQRIHTSHPEEYPVGGEKFMPPGAPWLQHVLVRQRTFLGAHPADVAGVFSDWPAIEALGCGATLNLPVVHDGTTLGSLSLLDVEGAYDENSILKAAPLTDLAREPLLAWHRTHWRNP